MSTARHNLRITFHPGNESNPAVAIECLTPDACGPVYREPVVDWRDETSCHCTEPDCECRHGDHDACCDGTEVHDMGPSCRLDAEEGSCWYRHALEECDWDMLHIETELVFTVPVELVGHGWDEAIDVTPLGGAA